jgi:hypothetical protein
VAALSGNRAQRADGLEEIGGPKELATARPKRLRFLILNVPGRLVHHRRKVVLRLAAAAEWIAAYQEGLSWLRAT